MRITTKELREMVLDAGVLFGNKSDGTGLGPIRTSYMRLIGEVWRLRSKVRYLAQRVKELEGRSAPVELRYTPANGAPQLPPPAVEEAGS